MAPAGNSLRRLCIALTDAPACPDTTRLSSLCTNGRTKCSSSRQFLVLFVSCVVVFAVLGMMQTKMLPRQGFLGVATPTIALSLTSLEDSDISQLAGVYKSPELSKRFDMERTLLMVTANSGMQMFLENWMCHANRLGLKYLVHCMDHELHENLQMRHIPTLLSGIDSGGYAKYRQGAYFNLTQEKLVMVKSVLKRGYDVLFSDADVAFLKDPFREFRRDSDIEAQTAEMRSDGSSRRMLCTGFYLAKSNTRVIDYLDTILSYPEGDPQQTIAEKVMHERKIDVRLPNEEKNSDADFRVLDAMSIVVGNSLNSRRQDFITAMDNLQNRTFSDIRLIHANFVVGKDMKYEMLAKTGTWVCPEEDSCDRCLPFSVEKAAEAIKNYASRDRD